MGENTLVIPSGRLTFGSGQSLYEMDLQTCQMKNLFTDNLSTFSMISKVDENNFIFSKYGQKGIYNFNIKTRKIRLIYKHGTSPYYNLTSRKMFFYHAPSFEVGNGLYAADINNPKNTAKRITDTRYAVENLISVSASEFVFIRNDSGNSNNVYLYNIFTNKLTQLPIQNCTLPTIWRSKTKQLMCFNRNEYQYFLTDLSGENVEKTGLGRNFLPVLYLPEYDELLFTKESFSFNNPERGHLGIYSFASGESKILCDDIKLGAGDAVYYEN